MVKNSKLRVLGPTSDNCVLAYYETNEFNEKTLPINANEISEHPLIWIIYWLSGYDYIGVPTLPRKWDT